MSIRPSPFGGLDSYGARPATWMNILYRNSNFDFTLHYLTHHPRGIVERPSDTSWNEAFEHLRPQGWGFGFCYIALNQNQSPHLIDEISKGKPKQKNLTKQQIQDLSDKAAALGQTHGRVVKEIVFSLGHEAQGSVVLVDNEDQNGGHLEEWTLVYYDALFKEMKTSGTHPPVRPGLYTRRDPMIQMMSRNPTLFWWPVETGTKEQVYPQDKYPPYPFKYVNQKISTPIENVGLPVFKFPVPKTDDEKSKDPEDGGGKKGEVVQRTAPLLGRQWILYHDKDNFLPGKTMKGLPRGLQPIAEWDFDCSSVRDPRYPVAQPRIGICGPIQVQGNYNKADLSMLVEQVVLVPRTKLPTPSTEEQLEPEAPLRFAANYVGYKGPDVQPPGPELFTLNKMGQLVSLVSTTTSQNDQALCTWAPPVKVLQEDPEFSIRLRRNRAFTVVCFSSVDDVQLFFAADDYSLQGTRRLLPAGWSAPQRIGDDVLLHPFSDVTAVTRTHIAVDVFFVDANGLLHTAWWPVSEKNWPGTGHHQPLQTKATLLSDTALYAITPTPDCILVFGIGEDCHLHMAVYSSNSGWSPLEVIPGLLKEVHLFPHAKIHAYAKFTDEIYVAAITEQSEPCIYVLQGKDSTWKLKEARVISNPPPTVPKVTSEGATYAPAPDWSFNAFGDIQLGRLDGTMTLWIAGVAPGKTGLLLKKIDMPDQVWNLVT